MTVFAFITYFLILVFIAVLSKLRAKTLGDFLLGSRQMGFIVTALAAHASDMSSWIFIGFPAQVYTHGLLQAAVAFGLVFFMFLNWQFIAPRLRRQSEMYNSYTISSLFESKTSDTSGSIRIVTALISTLFYLVYIAAGMIGLGITLEMIFHIPYVAGVILGVVLTVPYLFFGGYITLAWTDLVQGFFLLFVILFVPIYAYSQAAGQTNVQFAPRFFDWLPATQREFGNWLYLFLGWGLGYFGQPHILTKFMGIREVEHMSKAKWVGISWQSFALLGSVLNGVVAHVSLKSPVLNSEFIFINLVQSLFSTFAATFILCAVLGVAITVANAQILVVSSNFAEDFYKKLFRKAVSPEKEVKVLRSSFVLVTLMSAVIAAATSGSLFNVVSYAWFGLGASFGPALILALYMEKLDKHAVLGGVITGAFASGVWPFVGAMMGSAIPSIIVGFFCHFVTFFVISYLKETGRKEA